MCGFRARTRHGLVGAGEGEGGQGRGLLLLLGKVVEEGHGGPEGVGVAGRVPAEVPHGSKESPREKGLAKHPTKQKLSEARLMFVHNQTHTGLLFRTRPELSRLSFLARNQLTKHTHGVSGELFGSGTNAWSLNVHKQTIAFCSEDWRGKGVSRDFVIAANESRCPHLIYFNLVIRKNVRTCYCT